MTGPPKFHVAICGGGIGGLALALSLAPYKDITFDIYEGASRFEEIGAGIGIWGRGRAVLKKMGLEEKISAIASVPPGIKESRANVRRSDLPAGGEKMGDLVLSTLLGLHRAQLLNLLVDILKETGRGITHFRKRCVSFTQDMESTGRSSVTLHFADGTSASCDVLIGCDGIKSAVRGKMLSEVAQKNPETVREKLGHFAGTQFSRTIAYRALVMPDDLKKINPEHTVLTTQTMYCGKDKHVVAYPVAGRFINVVAYSSDLAKQAEWAHGPWVVDVERKELIEQYSKFEPDVQAILKCISQPSRWAMYTVEPLPFWSKGRVAILGDAAHAIPPFVGAGGGQVVEDAYVLGKLLGSSLATRATLPSVLLAYEHVRKPIANKALLTTLEVRDGLEFGGKYEDSANEEIVKSLNETVAWMLEDRADLDRLYRDAEAWLQKALGVTSEA